MIEDLAPGRLRRIEDPKGLGPESAKEFRPAEGIIGQGRAVSAMRFGLGIDRPGFNIYVAGQPGIGKMTAVQAFVETLARAKGPASDWCYVNNFEDPYRPRVLRLPAGCGRKLRREMRTLIEQVRRELPKAFESEDYVQKRDQMVKELDRRRAEVLEALDREVAASGFMLQATPVGILIVPALGGRPLSEEEFRDLPGPAREDLDRKRELLQDRMKAAMRQVRDLARGTQAELHAMNERAALYIVGGLIDDVAEKHADQPDVLDYLQAVQKDIVENIEIFRAEPAAQEAPPGLAAILMTSRARELPFRRYHVNVVVDNARLKGAPVVAEANPTYSNLIGRVERESEFGAVYTDFTMIRGGSLHLANGGFLVIPVEDLLRDGYGWEALKRCLRSREVQMEELAERFGFAGTKTLRPQPIPLDVKVVLVGRPLYYALLHAFDESFPELFKVKADFDTSVTRGEFDTAEFLGFLRAFCVKEGICTLSGEAAAKVLEHAARLAEDQERVSMQLGLLADLVREANHWAHEEGSEVIGATHVRKALDAKIYRSNLIEQRIREMISRGTLLIDTEGEAVGQVNGLAVLSLGDYAFGKPNRITASAGPGREGIVDIEREAKLGGPIHSKGVLILSGYLIGAYARERPLSLAARVVFEQSYEGVEGDSASSAELYALLSALSGLPMKQGVAVTGSVNQHGRIQAIGGVNEKIEGFFDVCRVRGLDGEQGVLIPKSNVPHLMLREDVVEAVASKRFHVWAVETVDDGMQLLTGIPAGSRQEDGTFEERSVNGRVEAALARFAKTMVRDADTAAAK